MKCSRTAVVLSYHRIQHIIFNLLKWAYSRLSLHTIPSRSISFSQRVKDLYALQNATSGSSFTEAWKQAFTTKNVQSAWKKTGIYPFDQYKSQSTFVLPQETSQTSAKKLKTPSSPRGIRRTFKQLQKEGHVNEKAEILLHASEKLAAELEIVRYENQGLQKTFNHGKKKRKRGKAINLYDWREKRSGTIF